MLCSVISLLAVVVVFGCCLCWWVGCYSLCSGFVIFGAGGFGGTGVVRLFSLLLLDLGVPIVVVLIVVVGWWV